MTKSFENLNNHELKAFCMDFYSITSLKKPIVVFVKEEIVNFFFRSRPDQEDKKHLYSCHLRCLFSTFWCRHWKTAAIFDFFFTRYLCTKFHVNSLFQWRLRPMIDKSPGEVGLNECKQNYSSGCKFQGNISRNFASLVNGLKLVGYSTSILFRLSFYNCATCRIFNRIACFLPK